MNHILKNHPKMKNEEAKLIEVISNPAIILEGDFEEVLAAKFYPKSPVTADKYLVVAYKEINKLDGFLITAYFTRRLSKRRKVLWKP